MTVKGMTVKAFPCSVVALLNVDLGAELLHIEKRTGTLTFSCSSRFIYNSSCQINFLFYLLYVVVGNNNSKRKPYVCTYVCTDSGIHVVSTSGLR